MKNSLFLFGNLLVLLVNRHTKGRLTPDFSRFNIFTPRLLVFCIVLLLVKTSMGQAADDYRTRASGNWNATATWQRFDGTTWVDVNGVAPNTIPTSADKIITIRNSHTVSVTANTSVDQVIVDAGGQVIVSSGKTLTILDGTGTDMIVNGTISNNGTIGTTGTLGFNANAVYIHDRNGGTIPAATWQTTATCLVTGITNSVPGGLNQSFGNFTWDCATQTSNISLAGDLTTVNGHFTVAGTGSGTDVLRLTNATDLTMYIGGDFIFSGGNLFFTDNKADVIVNVSGNFAQSGGSLDFSDDNEIGVLGLNVNGNFSQAAGTFDFSSGNANTTRTPSLHLSGNFSQTGTGTITTSTGDNDIVNGTITFNKNGIQTLNIATPTHITYTNFVVNANSRLQLNSNLVLSSNSITNWAGSFTVGNNGTLEAGTNQVLSSTGAAGGNNNAFILNAGAAISTANVSGLQSGNSGTISTSLANRIFSSSANYTFNGQSTQNSGTFITTPVANQVNNLTINNTGGSTGLTLQQVLAVAGTCYFTAGLITTSSSYLLMFNDNAVASGANNNAGNPSFVNGPVRKIGNDIFTFPVGKLNAGYMLCGISAPSNITDAFTAEYKRNNAAALGSITAPGLARVSACEYWMLDRTTGSSNVNVTLSWSGISPCSAAAYVNSLTYLVVAHFNGTNWNAYGNNGGTTGNAAAGTVTWNNVSSFSPFTLGSTNAATNPLPVRFSLVKAFIIKTGNQIEWKNLTEENIQKYEVERSGNGTTFTTIAVVTPKGNDGQEQHYIVADEQLLPGTNFYRIKAFQTDGSYLYSVIVSVTPPATTTQNYLSVYPNPVVSSQFILQLDNYKRGSYVMKLISGSGLEVLAKMIQHPGGSISFPVQRPGVIPPGLYVLQLTGAGVNETRKLILK